MTKNSKFGLHMNVSTHTGVVVLLVLSFFVAWFTVKTGGKIVSNAPQSKMYDSQKKAQKMIDQNVK